MRNYWLKQSRNKQEVLFSLLCEPHLDRPRVVCRGQIHTYIETVGPDQGLILFMESSDQRFCEWFKTQNTAYGSFFVPYNQTYDWCYRFYKEYVEVDGWPKQQVLKYGGLKVVDGGYLTDANPQRCTIYNNTWHWTTAVLSKAWLKFKVRKIDLAYFPETGELEKHLG